LTANNKFIRNMSQVSGDETWRHMDTADTSCVYFVSFAQITHRNIRPYTTVALEMVSLSNDMINKCLNRSLLRLQVIN
jgi:hypothetical protein